MRYAILENGIVTNIMIADDSFNCDKSHILLNDDNVCIGYIYNEKTKEFISNTKENEYQVIIPQSLSRFQALTILKLTKLEDGNTLYQATDDYINSLNDYTVENITAKTAWETAQEFRRDSNLIQLAEKLFNLTNEQVDEMFINGAKITA